MEENENSTEDVMKDRKEEKAEKEDSRLKGFVKDSLENGKIGKKVDKLKKAAKRKAKKAIRNAAKTGAKTVGGLIAMILIIIFMSLGIIQFLISMPGMVQEGIWQKVDNVLTDIGDFFKGKNNTLNDDEKIYETKLEVLNYIQSMGIDVVGFGFVSMATITDDGEVVDFEDDLFNDELIKDDNSKKTTLYKYIVGALRIYAINDDGFWDIGKFFKINDQKGMLNILNEGATQSCEVLLDEKKLNISNWNAHLDSWFNRDEFSFNLDGWSSRYGFPLDLSITLHLATMSSGFVEELITNPYLQTMVNINIDEVNASVEYILKNNSGIEISYDNGISLFQKFLESSSIDNITKEDVSIKGLIELAGYTQTEVSNYDYYIRTYEDDRELKGSKSTFGGISKCLDAMDALTSTHKFLCSNVNKIYKDLSDLGNTADLYYGAYIGDLDENGYIDPTKGVFGAVKLDMDDAELQQYRKEDNTYVLYQGENRFDDTQSINTYFSEEFSENYRSVLMSIRLDGIGVGGGMSDDLFNEWAEEAKNELFDGDGDAMVEEINRLCQSDFGNVYTNVGYGMDYDHYAQLDYTYFSGSEAKNAFTRLVGYARVLAQIDQFICSYGIHNMTDLQEKEGRVERFVTQQQLEDLSNATGKDDMSRFYYDFTEYNDFDWNVPGYYRQLFYDMCRDCDFTNLYWEYDEDSGRHVPSVIEQLDHDKELIREEMNKNNSVINNLLEKNGYSGLTMDMVYDVYQNAQLNNNDIDFIQPRILSVIKHWYKDIDYGDAYSGTDEIEVPYTGESGLEDSEWFVTALIRPNDGKKIYTQVKQPYVIKGDIVTLDDEVVENAELTDLYDEDESGLDSDILDVELDGGKEKYHWGDGYRTSKRIFTEGFYYTYDGSAETSRSIYFQEQIETYKNTSCYIAVKNGRIVSLMPMSRGNSYTFGDGITYNGNWSGIVSQTEEVSCSVSDVSIRFAGETVNTKDETVKWYVLNIGNSQPMKYLSTTSIKDMTYSEAKLRVDDINKVWDAVGVYVKRKPLSFDTKDAEGNIMTLTAFSILENSKSEDAEVIYRDLKELLIDLGYFSKAEFESLEKDVLSWFIPQYKPRVWPQNNLNDAVEYGSMLYPYAPEDDENEDTDETEEESLEEAGEGRSDGFGEGLSIIAPGNCIITKRTEDTIKLKFDASEQPEISSVDGYEMIITGLKTKGSIDIVDENDNESTISVQSAIQNKTLIPDGTVIGETGTTKIQVIMKTSRGAYINNVYDYMSPGIIGSIGDLEWLYFYFIPFEGLAIDDLDNGAGCAVKYDIAGGTEYAVGICQWTIRGEMDNIRPLLLWLYEKDPSVCAELAAFQSWDTSKITSNYDRIVDAFHSINHNNPERFLQLQMEYALEQKKKDIEGMGLGWLFDSDRNGVTVGSLISLLMWRPGFAYQDVINQNMTDEEIIKTLFAYAWEKSPEAADYDAETIAVWRHRWPVQAYIAISIMNGERDAEEFVKEGTNNDDARNSVGILQDTLRRKGWSN